MIKTIKAICYKIKHRKQIKKVKKYSRYIY